MQVVFGLVALVMVRLGWVNKLRLEMTGDLIAGFHAQLFAALHDILVKV